MHICFVTSAFGRRDSLIVVRQARSLVASGYKVSYVLCDELPDENKDGIEMISVGRAEKSLLGRIFRNNKRLKKFLKDKPADVYQMGLS